MGLMPNHCQRHEGWLSLQPELLRVLRRSRLWKCLACLDLKEVASVRTGLLSKMHLKKQTNPGICAFIKSAYNHPDPLTLTQDASLRKSKWDLGILTEMPPLPHCSQPPTHWSGAALSSSGFMDVHFNLPFTYTQMLDAYRTGNMHCPCLLASL